MNKMAWSQGASGLKIGAGLLVLIITTSRIFAQSSSDKPAVPPPAPPYIKVPPLPLAWEVSATLLHPTPSSNPHRQSDAYFVKHLRIVQTQDTRQEILTFGSGIATEQWFSSGCLLLEQPNDTVIHLIPSYAGEGTPFSEFSWLDLSNYIGTETKGDKLCYVFMMKTSSTYASPELQQMAQAQMKAFRASEPGNISSPPPQNSTLKAWIDVSSKFPVALEDPRQAKVYTLLPTPGVIRMPDRFRSVLDEYQKKLAAPNQHHMKL